jgi:hypothetical protein
MGQVLEEDQKFLDYIAHFGVKGMRWGVTRADNKAKNKAYKAEQKKARAKEVEEITRIREGAAKIHAQRVDKARERVNSGKTKAAYKQAKADYQKNKAELGSREAKQILRRAREFKMNEIATARQIRDGKEASRAILLNTGITLLVGTGIALANK